ncbi:MAG TPA: DUF4233 domain-containing protein [Trebonia sp.]|jgi:hypothetical protein|nr:DUF4233 domain-containing protein [Trebonia sp.]
MKRLCGTVLGMEAVVAALCIVPSIVLLHVRGGIAGGVGGAIAIIAIVLARLVGRPGKGWVLIVGSVLQVLVIASGVLLPVMYVLGVIFAALWFGGIRLARKWESVDAARAAGSAQNAPVG